MRQVLSLLVACALARADRYSDDYAGVSMPHYSMEEGNRDDAEHSEDYPERSPDSPLPFDYKYQEGARDKINKIPINAEEENGNEKLKKPYLSDHDDELQTHLEDIEAPIYNTVQHKERRKNRRYRTRVKDKEIDGQRENNYRHKSILNARSQKIDNNNVDIRNEYYTSKGRDDNSIESEDVNVKIRETTEKLIRRKPRDRRINIRRSLVDDEDVYDDLKDLEREYMAPARKGGNLNPHVRDGDAEYVESRKANSRRFMLDRPRPMLVKNKMRNKKYEDYDDDYYDMKRVNDMKNKLPDLVRRTKASTTETLKTRPMQDLNNRRANYSESDKELTTKNNTPDADPTARTDLSKTAKSTASARAINNTELSIAEKSRLSILKKAQRKDDDGNTTWTTKPPVLMQVTKRMQTLVMVEPSQAGVRLRAKEILEDSPERIERAKKLMRGKLVAGARNIHELTDNWDEMVCDYIDVSLLDGSPVTSPQLKLLIVTGLWLFW